ncbi:MAG TPA: ThuA domain-containing protein [Fibrobacteria bacterium]|nr:ThuA domain-containing protein [Fibrobacteria bacterium]
MGQSRRVLLEALCLCLYLSARAQVYQGSAKEARYGSGVDSVSVTLKRTGARTFTDSAGRFSILPTALARPGSGASELLWLAGSRTIAWTAEAGPISVTVNDASGGTATRFAAAGGVPGRKRLPALHPGIYFASVLAFGRRFSWSWCESGGGAAGPSLALPEPRVRVFSGPVSAVAASKTATSGADAPDTLIFAKRGFATLEMPVSGSSSALEAKLARLPIKVLIVDGMSNHYWEQTTKVAEAVYAKAGYFSVDVSTAPSVSAPSAWQAWRPRFSAYEVVLMNYNSGNASGSLAWPRDKQIQLEEFVNGGGGLYVLHSANNSFPDWPEYNKMIGTGWRTKGFGPALKVDASGAVVRIPAGDGQNTSHGNRADALIHVLQDHPINKGYPRAYLSATLEIYSYARGPAENCNVLSYALDGPASGGTLINWPIELLVEYGKGRVYNATPGHIGAGETTPNAVRDLSFQTTLIRATEWLARREVLYPVPAAFNTETKIVYRDLVLP